MSQPQIFYDTEVEGNFTTSWTYIPFGFYTRELIIVAPLITNTDDIYYSWDGQNIHGRVSITAYSINLQGQRRNGIYIKTNSGSQGAQITGY